MILFETVYYGPYMVEQFTKTHTEHRERLKEERCQVHVFWLDVWNNCAQINFALHAKLHTRVLEKGTLFSFSLCLQDFVASFFQLGMLISEQQYKCKLQRNRETSVCLPDSLQNSPLDPHPSLPHSLNTSPISKNLLFNQTLSRPTLLAIRYPL